MSLPPDLLGGRWGSLPTRRPSNLVRVFVSSAPADMAVEREALMELAYPEVGSLCQKHGLTLEVVDLRWGIRDGPGTGHAATQLFLEEIRRCQELSVGPSFVVPSRGITCRTEAGLPLPVGTALGPGPLGMGAPPARPRRKRRGKGPGLLGDGPFPALPQALLGSHYGPRPAPLAIGGQEWEALRRTRLLEEPRTELLLAQWYRKDENAVPPAYVLQRPAQASPGELEQRLAPALRRAAWAAERQGLLSREQREPCHRSETHGEIEAGLFSSGGRGEDGGATAVVFFREVAAGDDEDEGDGSGDRQRLAELKARIAGAYPEQVKVHTVPRDVEPGGHRRQPRPKYLKELCQQFVAAASRRILGALHSREEPLAGPPGLAQESAHHAALAQERGRGPCWQPDLLERLCRHMQQHHLRDHPPLLIQGPTGCGKTALLGQLCVAAAATLGPETAVVVRLVGTSQASSWPDGLLHSLCLQICLAVGLPPPPPPCARGARGSPPLLFRRLLLSASRQGARPLVVLLDAVERLGGPGDPPLAAWVPRLCPPRVHLVLTAQQEGCGALLRTLLDPQDSFEVGPLSAERATEVLSGDLARAGRTLQPAQWAVFQKSFPGGGLALPVACATREACQWPSYASLSASEISPTASEFAHRLCGRLEEAHGPVLVAHALGYLACARYGLSEAELKDVLSLDDQVLLEFYQRPPPPPPPRQGFLRFPPLLWAQLHRDLAPWLEDRWANGFGLLGFRHREFSAVVEERYLSTPEERAQRHLLLADFFRGTWSWGMKKPLWLPSSSKPVSLDRKVTPQPLWFSSAFPNRRKLSELPFHLLQAGRMEELQREVWGNMSWIACGAAASGVERLAADVALCLERTGCPELRLLREALLLLGPTLDGTEGARGETSTVYSEMLARLHPLAPSYPSLVGRMCQQCERWLGVWPHPVLVPLCGFLYPPGGPLRRTLLGCPEGTSVLEFCLDRGLLLAGSLDGSVIVWDLEDFAVRHVLTGHSAEVRCVRVFGDGRRTASAALDHTLRLWSLESGREELSICPGERPCRQIHVDEKNRLVYWVSDSEVQSQEGPVPPPQSPRPPVEVAAWSLELAAPAFRIPAEPPGGWLCAAVFLPRLAVVTVSERGGLGLWDSLSGELRARRGFPGLGQEAPTCSVLLSKHGRMVAGFSGGSLLAVSSDGNSLLEQLPEGIRFVVPSEDESLLAAGFGRRVRVFLAEAMGFRRLLASDLVHEEEVCAAAISADNGTLVTSSGGECIWVWRLSQEGLLVGVLGAATGTPTTLLALSEAALVSASRHGPDLRVWDLSRGRNPPLPRWMAGPACVGLSHDGRYIYFPPTSGSCNVVLWDSEKGEAWDTLDASAPVQCLEVAERRQLLFVGVASGTVLVFPLDSGPDVGCIPPAESHKAVRCLALTQEEEQLAVAGEDLVRVLDVGRGEAGLLLDRPAYTFYTQIPGAAISSLALLAGYRVLYGMTNGELFLYHCPQGHVFPLDAHGGSSITCLKTSHGEGWALSGSADALRCLWDVELRCWEHQMFFRKQDSFAHGVLCACFSRDDRYLFTGSLDQCVTVWDVSRGALLAVQFVHAKVTRIVSTADGFVATTSLGYLVRERFRCPPSVSPRHDPLGSLRATCRVKSRKREGEDPADRPGGQRNTPLGRPGRANKLSQICRIA
ncbi:NACHT domain- and WD repeat-containing protein 1 [Elgaria multicarinata webbii]|uniref:NACHT domain- and WD repeat-containing protein 1 n=1 Tax=Elgaria multicarinata webbii TaxID=159646 RepID=UPI002FCCE207